MKSHTSVKNPLNNEIFININGELFKRNEAKISVFDSGFLLGDGIWEGIRLHNSKLLFIKEHLNRLFHSANGIDLKIALTKAEIIDEIFKVINKNEMTNDVHIRLIITRGDKITPYQNPKANIGPINYVIIPEHKKSDPKIYDEGLHIGRVNIIRPTENILNTHLNTLSKLNCILGSIEANKLGYDEGIMDDINGNISTCNSTNLFFVLKNEVWTSTGKYCLNGITRGKVIDICKKNNIQCYQKDFKYEDISNCDEAFVTGTFAGVIPVSMLEGKLLHSTQKQSLTNYIRLLLTKETLNN
jgi:branched-chain amino acid aminotransferase